MSVLPDWMIRDLCLNRGRDEKSMVTPYDEEQLQPASYDVRLGNKFIVIETHDDVVIDLDDPKVATKMVDANERGYFVIHPGQFVLCHTKEFVSIPNDIVSRIEGKSSVGRLGLAIHVTAGFIDPGFNGSVTLEMVNFSPLAIKMRPGQLIAQLSFEKMEAECNKPYAGRYQGDKSVAASRYGQTLKAVEGIGPGEFGKIKAVEDDEAWDDAERLNASRTRRLHSLDHTHRPR